MLVSTTRLNAPVHDVSCGFVPWDVVLAAHPCRFKSGASSQVRSGLGVVKRDWSSNKPQNIELDEPDSDVLSGWSPSPPSTTTAQALKSRLDGIQASLSNRITSSERLLSSSRSSQKRAAEPSDFLPQPPHKKRLLPSSFLKGRQPSAKSLSRTTSLSSRPPSTFAYSKQHASISLSQEQNYVLKLAQEGKSLFYTGSAGTGKSVLLREIIKALHKKYLSAPDSVAVTASTGTFRFMFCEGTIPIPFRYRRV